MNPLRQQLRLAYGERGQTSIGQHLGSRYGIEVDSVATLAPGVYRVDQNKGPSWVARVFMPGRSRERVDGDAECLRVLAAHELRAERLADPDPVSVCDDQPVLVTELVQGTAPRNANWALADIGRSLGILHALPIDQFPNRPGGSLHHIPGFEGLPGEDIRLAGAILDDITNLVTGSGKTAFDKLRRVVDEVDLCSDLPYAFVHPDPVPVNLIATAEKHVVLIDWAGCGIGPRITCLAQTLAMCWNRRAWDRKKLQTLASAYGEHVRLTEAEVERVADAIRLRPVWLAAWNYWTRTLRARPPKGDEWWLMRAFAAPDRELVKLVRETFAID